MYLPVKLNPHLVKKQKLTSRDIERLMPAYEELALILSKDCPLPVDEIEDAITGAEYKLQRLWQFDLNYKMHSYWFHSERCSCPKVENSELFGTGLRHYGRECELHKHHLVTSYP